MRRRLPRASLITRRDAVVVRTTHLAADSLAPDGPGAVTVVVVVVVFAVVVGVVEVVSLA